MSKVEKLVVICIVVGLAIAVSGTAQANWYETFNGDVLDLPTWVFSCFPDVTKTFTHTIKTDANGNKYLSLDETTLRTIQTPAAMARHSAQPSAATKSLPTSGSEPS